MGKSDGLTRPREKYFPGWEKFCLRLPSEPLLIALGSAEAPKPIFAEPLRKPKDWRGRCGSGFWSG